MRILVIGSGGREHALCWAIGASPLVDRLYCAPGNAGIAEDAECVAIAADNTRGIIEFCKRAAIDFVVVGPEAPLVAGLVDTLEGEGIAAFGPSRAASTTWMPATRPLLGVTSCSSRQRPRRRLPRHRR
jgi:phosphoribosylamine--glycine ligase